MTELQPHITEANLSPFVTPEIGPSLYDEPRWLEDINAAFVESAADTVPAVQETEQIKYGFVARLKETGKTLGHETWEKGHRIKRLGALGVAGGTQFADRMRVMAFALPTAFERSLTYSFENNLSQPQAIGLSAVAVGGLWGLWSSVVGKSFDKSIKAFPQTTETVMKNHSAMVGAIESAIDGFPKESDGQVLNADGKVQVGPYDAADTKASKFGMGITRGIKTALLFGSTAHVGVARIRNHSDKSVSRRLRSVVGESTAFFGALAAGVSAMVLNEVKGAQGIQDAVSNEKLLGGVTVGLIAYSGLANYLARRKFNKENTNKG